ncbi:MAG: hypothetical protein JW871_07240 [Endomicrobiales bacterium]|nr:hypothetical protein [Endomicrobiales bacterium]
MKKFLTFVLVVGLMCTAAYGADVATVINASLIGGQNAIEGETSSFSGNFNLDVIPAIKFSERTTLLPLCYLEYRGVKQVNELADGNILFQQGFNYNVALKPVFTLGNNMKMRIKTGYFMQYLKESDDETLSDGAFNYSKTTAGLDFSGTSYSIGYSINLIQFPNYQEVYESNSDQYGSAGAGIATQGTDILNYSAHDIYITKKFPVSPVFMLDITADYMMKLFDDQKVADTESTVSSDMRTDNSLLVNLFPSMALVPTGPTTIFCGLSLTYIMYDSNQNYGDGAVFTKSYYNYSDIKIGPMFNFSFNKLPLRLNTAFEISTKSYSDRLAQEEDGTYKTDKTTISTTYLNFNLIYPVMENLNINFNPSILVSSSNMKDETYYRYNYNASSIFLGVSYSYE